MANTNTITYTQLAPVFKFEEVDDNNLRVFGKATNETVDSDEQIVDIAWAGKALTKWLETGGNMRVMHNPNRDPAGVGIGIDIGADGINLTSDVGEPTAVKLVKMGALRAFSVGISGAKIVKDLRARGGRIVGGQIVEVSLVDRPANPDCAFNLVKMAGSEQVWTADEVEGDVEALVEKHAAGNDDVVTEEIGDEIYTGDATGAPVTDENDSDKLVDPNDNKNVETDAKAEDNNGIDIQGTTSEGEHVDTGVENKSVEQAETDERTSSEVPQSERAPDVVPEPDAAAEVAVPTPVSVTLTEPVITPVETSETVVKEGVASWAARRLHDISCPAYSTTALKEVYPTLEKDGLSSALGPPAKGMLYQLLSQEVGEDGGTGVEADDIHEIAKAYNALNRFIDSEAMEGEITTADFGLAAREELRKGAKIEDSADPGDAVRTKSGRVFYGEDSPLKSLHDALVNVYPSMCTLDVDKSVTADVTKAATVDVEHLVAERVQEITTKWSVEKTEMEDQSAELVKAHEAELVKLNEQIEELSKAPQLAVTTSGTQAPSRAVRGVQLNKSIAIEDVQKRAQDNERAQRVQWLQNLAQSGSTADAYVANEMLAKLGVND